MHKTWRLDEAEESLRFDFGSDMVTPNVLILAMTQAQAVGSMEKDDSAMLYVLDSDGAMQQAEHVMKSMRLEKTPSGYRITWPSDEGIGQPALVVARNVTEHYPLEARVKQAMEDMNMPVPRSEDSFRDRHAMTCSDRRTLFHGVQQEFFCQSFDTGPSKCNGRHKAPPPVEPMTSGVKRHRPCHLATQRL
ncbi:hypothetical protein MPSEU_000444900 [Mayamaea pseudoterrestris]|nr:hypothetical protein MPSEU_000444900 [Mayamaea pseudoterrestris]